MLVYPAIDLRGGRVVRLHQGRAEAETAYEDDPTVPARQFLAAGAPWVHVVDLDGAFSGKPQNADAVGRIAATGLKVQLGGGLRDAETVADALASGASRVVLGTRAAADPDFVQAMVAAHGGERIAVGIDARDGKVAVKGWVETLDLDATEMARNMASLGVQTIIYTDISRDGTLEGPNFEAQAAMARAVEASIIASGGVGKDAHLEQFRDLHAEMPNLAGVIVGRAIYDGRIDLARAFA